MPAPTTGGSTDVQLMPCSFEPTVTTVAVGTAVRFVNESVFVHLITGANQAWGSPEVEVQPNATVSYAFDRAGVYPYACALHPGMSGAIVVGDPADALSAGTSGTSTTGSTDAATGASTGEDSMAAGASAAGATTDATTSWGLTFALGAVAGLMVGAAAVWLSVRRRRAADRRLAGAA